MDECSCKYCYSGVCFHPLRGEDAGLGVPCDGCHFEEPETPTEGLEGTIHQEDLNIIEMLHENVPHPEGLNSSEEETPIALSLFGRLL